MEGSAWFGVDPGPVSGCICVLQEGAGVGVPPKVHFHKAKDLTTTESFSLLFSSYGLLRCGTLEKVWVMPGQGLTSQSKLVLHRGQMEGVMSALGVVSGVPWHLLAPQVWRKMLGLAPESDKKKRKRDNRELAGRLYPGVKLTNDTVDALLLAHVAKKLSS